MTLPLAALSKGEKPPEPMDNREAPDHQPGPSTQPEPPKPGGFFPVDLDDPAVEEALMHLKTYLQSREMSSEGIEIIRADRQTVAGQKVRLLFRQEDKEMAAIIFYPLGQDDVKVDMIPVESINP